VGERGARPRHDGRTTAGHTGTNGDANRTPLHSTAAAADSRRNTNINDGAKVQRSWRNVQNFQDLTAQSREHRRRERVYRALELELATLDPFLNSLDETERIRIKGTLAMRYFLGLVSNGEKTDV
jgi:hypothetical protein